MTAYSRVMLTARFLGLAVRYWLGVFPRVCTERRRQRARALAIPDPRLREVALEAQRKWGNVEGAAAFAALAPRGRRAATTRALVSFQAAYNYLDLLSERPSPDPAANGRRLHSALVDALEVDAVPVGACADRRGRACAPPGHVACDVPTDRRMRRSGRGRMRPRHNDDRPALSDYYADNPERVDGGYLEGLVEDCRDALATLPAYDAVAPAALQAARRIVAFQSCNTGELGGDFAALERWADAAVPAEEGLRWWEIAASAGSSLCIYALIALAAAPADDPEADVPEAGPTRAHTHARVEAVRDAYFPWIGALHSLLDNLVDITEDQATGQHNLIGRYASPEEAATRMGVLAERSSCAAAALPDGRGHVLVLAAMASFYLSLPAAATPAARPVADAVRDALDGPAALAMLVFKARRPRARETGVVGVAGDADADDADAGVARAYARAQAVVARESSQRERLPA